MRTHPDEDIRCFTSLGLVAAAGNGWYAGRIIDLNKLRTEVNTCALHSLTNQNKSTNLSEVQELVYKVLNHKYYRFIIKHTEELLRSGNIDGHSLLLD